MLSTSVAALGFTGPAVQAPPASRVATPRMESLADFKGLAKDLNPLLGAHPLPCLLPAASFARER